MGMHMEKGRVRIVDIADELGLSTATVSNVIHGKTKKISGETVKRVQELLEKKGYIPNMAGILLAQNNSRIVGIIINNHEKYENHVLEDAFISASLNALAGELDKAGYFMMVRVTAQWREIAKVASMWNMEGLVLIGFCEQDYKKLRESMHIPFVVYDGYFQETRGICNLVIDNYDGGYQAGAYLKRMGHKKALCVADNDICMDRERIEGFREGMKGCRVDFWQMPMARDARRKFYEEKWEEVAKYTAIFAVSDLYAMEWIYFLQGKGIRIPEEISVIGFDDSPWCEKIYPPLTSIRQDGGERAAKAISILQELKTGGCGEAVVTFPVRLVERGSVGKGPDAYAET